MKEKFFIKITEDTGIKIPKGAYIQRTYAGRHQKAAGAWISVIKSKSNRLFEIGLYIPIRKLIKCPKLIIGYSHGQYIDCGCSGGCKGLK